MKWLTRTGHALNAYRQKRYSDLGLANTRRLQELARLWSDATYIDLGVRFGNSSRALLSSAAANHNCVVGVDVDLSRIAKDVRRHPNYEMTCGDSVTVGLNWNPLRKVSIVFVDSIHTREIVLCELRSWIPHLVPGGFFVLHDTCWEPEKREVIGNVSWGRPDEAAREFFGAPNLSTFESSSVSIETFPDFNGMTFVQVHKPEAHPVEEIDWSEVMNGRLAVLSALSRTRELVRMGVSLDLPW